MRPRALLCLSLSALLILQPVSTSVNAQESVQDANYDPAQIQGLVTKFSVLDEVDELYADFLGRAQLSKEDRDIKKFLKRAKGVAKKLENAEIFDKQAQHLWDNLIHPLENALRVRREVEKCHPDMAETISEGYVQRVHSAVCLTEGIPDSEKNALSSLALERMKLKALADLHRDTALIVHKVETGPDKDDLLSLRDMVVESTIDMIAPTYIQNFSLYERDLADRDGSDKDRKQMAIARIAQRAGGRVPRAGKATSARSQWYRDNARNREANTVRNSLANILGKNKRVQDALDEALEHEKLMAPGIRELSWNVLKDRTVRELQVISGQTSRINELEARQRTIQSSVAGFSREPPSQDLVFRPYLVVPEYDQASRRIASLINPGSVYRGVQLGPKVDAPPEVLAIHGNRYGGTGAQMSWFEPETREPQGLPPSDLHLDPLQFMLHEEGVPMQGQDRNYFNVRYGSTDSETALHEHLEGLTGRVIPREEVEQYALRVRHGVRALRAAGRNGRGLEQRAIDLSLNELGRMNVDYYGERVPVLEVPGRELALVRTDRERTRQALMGSSFLVQGSGSGYLANGIGRVSARKLDSLKTEFFGLAEEVMKNMAQLSTMKGKKLKKALELAALTNPALKYQMLTKGPRAIGAICALKVVAKQSEEDRQESKKFWEKVGKVLAYGAAITAGVSAVLLTGGAALPAIVAAYGSAVVAGSSATAIGFHTVSAIKRRQMENAWTQQVMAAELMRKATGQQTLTPAEIARLETDAAMVRSQWQGDLMAIGGHAMFGLGPAVRNPNFSRAFVKPFAARVPSESPYLGRLIPNATPRQLANAGRSAEARKWWMFARSEVEHGGNPTVMKRIGRWMLDIEEAGINIPLRVGQRVLPRRLRPYVVREFDVLGLGNVFEDAVLAGRGLSLTLPSKIGSAIVPGAVSGAPLMVVGMKVADWQNDVGEREELEYFIESGDIRYAEAAKRRQELEKLRQWTLGYDQGLRGQTKVNAVLNKEFQAWLDEHPEDKKFFESNPNYEARRKWIQERAPQVEQDYQDIAALRGYQVALSEYTAQAHTYALPRGTTDRGFASYSNDPDFKENFVFGVLKDENLAGGLKLYTRVVKAIQTAPEKFILPEDASDLEQFPPVHRAYEMIMTEVEYMAVSDMIVDWFGEQPGVDFETRWRQNKKDPQFRKLLKTFPEVRKLARQHKDDPQAAVAAISSEYYAAAMWAMLEQTGATVRPKGQTPEGQQENQAPKRQQQNPGPVAKPVDEKKKKKKRDEAS